MDVSIINTLAGNGIVGTVLAVIMAKYFQLVTKQMAIIQTSSEAITAAKCAIEENTKVLCAMQVEIQNCRKR